MILKRMDLKTDPNKNNSTINLGKNGNELLKRFSLGRLVSLLSCEVGSIISCWSVIPTYLIEIILK